MMPLEISKSRNMKYNTVRSILNNFFKNGRVNVKKKISGYTKKRKGGIKIETQPKLPYDFEG